jgi:hypothetical protein
MAQGTQIHIAAWPGSGESRGASPPLVPSPRQLLLSRTFASQAGAYVIAASGLASREEYPERYRELFAGEETGDSCIIDPRGEVIAGPASGETILTATVSLEAVFAAKASCDVGGHYSRPDILQLLVNKQPMERLVESTSGANGRGHDGQSAATPTTGGLLGADSGNGVASDVPARSADHLVNTSQDI